LKFTKQHKFLFSIVFLLFIKSFAFKSNSPYSSSFFTGRSPQDRGVVSPNDSLKKVINKEANKASLMSMILPGLGQAYNHKYWKIPIIYAALGGIGYIAMIRNREYQDYHNELLFRYANPTSAPNSFPKYSIDQVNTEKIQAKKYRDFCFIGMGIVYLLNVIDANVGAHLKTFDVSDNLSLSIKPKAFYCSNSPYGLTGGVSLTLNFK